MNEYVTNSSVIDIEYGCSFIENARTKTRKIETTTADIKED